MEEHPLNSALKKVSNQKAVVNLIESNFHKSGFIPPPKVFEESFRAWLAQRGYKAESKGRLEARQSLADFYERGGHLSKLSAVKERFVNPEHLLLAASSSESYSLIFQEFCNPRDQVLLPLPSYPLFEDLVQYADLEPRFYPLDPQNNWEPDLNVMEALISEKTRFLVLISPNNPCGSLISETCLGAILELCLKEHLMLIVDEVFSEFLYNPLDKERGLARPAFQNPGVPVFTLNGISKLFACPDLKLGWIWVSGVPDGQCAPGFPSVPEIVDALEYRLDSYLNANDYSQFLLPQLFKNLAPFTSTMVSHLEEQNTYLKQSELKDLEHWKAHWPRAGIHWIIEYTGSHRKLAQFLKQKGYSAKDTSLSGKLCIYLLESEGLYLHPGDLYGLDEGCFLVLSLLGGFTGSVVAEKLVPQNDPSVWQRLSRALAHIA